MLAAAWETFATLLANAVTDADLVVALHSIVADAEINLATPAVVVYGHDTRPSCPALITALEDGLAALGCEQRGAGLVTTPLLHYLVKCYNTEGTVEAYGVPTEAGYYEKLSKAYHSLIVGARRLQSR